MAKSARIDFNTMARDAVVADRHLPALTTPTAASHGCRDERHGLCPPPNSQAAQSGIKSRILYTKPSITEREVSYATDAAANGWGAHCYDYIDRFEAAFREHLGVSYAIATSS